ncbi:MAG: arginine N-succinyltransferase [Candidatus Hydrogenedentes bacterium]|nr:arginine N-succinyltransferase [Candidatus Hydrogenedentota bacterium]
MSDATPTPAETPVPPAKGARRFGCVHVLAVILAGLLLSVLASAWWVKRNVYASPFRTTELNAREQAEFEAKVAQLEAAGGAAPAPGREVAVPEAYSEEGANREIRITEKELNALIDKNPQWADRVAIDISPDLLSLVLLVPVDPEFPIIGGTTARITAGATLRFENDQPVVIVRGISIGGIPLPSAWMGDLKNKDLIQEYGGQGGFWDGLARGVEAIKLEEGNLYLKLRE